MSQKVAKMLLQSSAQTNHEEIYPEDISIV